MFLVWQVSFLNVKQVAVYVCSNEISALIVSVVRVELVSQTVRKLFQQAVFCLSFITEWQKKKQ